MAALPETSAEGAVLFDGKRLVTLSPLGIYAPAAFAGARGNASLLGAGLWAPAGNPTVLDALAGWGSDGLELLGLGADLTFVERDARVAGMLRQRLYESELEAKVRVADCRDVFSERVWDVVYLDPMFPPRGRKGLAKKPLQVLRCLTEATTTEPETEPDLDTLLTHAIATAAQRVVLKRRRTDPVALTPDWQLKGRTIRFDVYRGAATRVQRQNETPR